MYGASNEGTAVPNVFDMIDAGNLGVPSQDEVAVHRVHSKVLGDGVLSCREALGYDRAAIDTASSGRVP